MWIRTFNGLVNSFTGAMLVKAHAKFHYDGTWVIRFIGMDEKSITPSMDADEAERLLDHMAEMFMAEDIRRAHLGTDED